MDLSGCFNGCAIWDVFAVKKGNKSLQYSLIIIKLKHPGFALLQGDYLNWFMHVNRQPCLPIAIYRFLKIFRLSTHDNAMHEEFLVPSTQCNICVLLRLVQTARKWESRTPLRKDFALPRNHFPKTWGAWRLGSFHFAPSKLSEPASKWALKKEGCGDASSYGLGK